MHFMKTFRRHRKVMLAVLTLLAMFSFVFLQTIYDIMQTGRGRSNPVVVKTTKYGSINERQLDMMLRQRQRLYMFLRQLEGMVRVKGGRGEAVREALGIFGNAPASEEAAVDDWLLARKAEDEGLKVSQKAINDYLASLTEGKVGNQDVRQILDRLRISQPQLFEALRQEMLTIRFHQMFWVSLAATTPAQRWEYYQQLNRRAKIEAVPLAVSKFADKVAAPSDEVLRAFFEKSRERLPDPNSPEPGFREPHRIDVEYFKANYETFVDLASVSDEAVRDYYEANKEQLYKDMLPEAPPPASPKAETPKAEAPKAEPGKAPGPAKETPKAEPPKRGPAKSDTPKSSSPAAEPTKSSPPKAEPPKAEASKPAAPKVEPPKSVAPKGKGTIPSPSKGTSVPRRSPFRLVAEQKTMTPAPPAKAQESAPKSDRPAAKSEPTGAKGSPAAPKTAPAATAAEAKAEAPAKAGKASDSGLPITLKTISQPGSPGAAGGATPVKYKPLADVKEEIRKALARQQAQKTVQDVLRRVQDKLAQYETQWTLYETSEPEKKGATTPPPRPNFVALAKENRLTAAQTGLLSALQMAGTDIGRSRAEGGASFLDVAFEKNVALFLPGTSQDNEGNSYLYWKLVDSLERVPAFDDPGVRQQVLDAWKLTQARDLAGKEAERLVAEARNTKKPIAEIVAGRKDLQVLSPAPFTWLTFGNVPVWFRMRPPQYSEVAGIPNAGSDFMRAVFNLKPGEIGVATDHPKATVYVIRLVEYTPSDSVLWDLFVVDDYRGYAMAARYDQATANRLWREGLKTEAGLHWERPPARAKVEAED